MQPKFHVIGRFYNTFSSGYLQVVSRELQQAFMWSVIFACLDSGTDILTSHGALSINMLHTKLISHEPIQQKRTYATYNKPKLILINEKEKHFMCIQLMFMCTGGGIKCISFLMCWLHMLSFDHTTLMIKKDHTNNDHTNNDHTNNDHTNNDHTNKAHDES